MKSLGKGERVITGMKLCASVFPLLTCCLVVITMSEGVVYSAVQACDFLSVFRDCQVILALLSGSLRIDCPSPEVYLRPCALALPLTRK
jgi:hypothetical protein